MADSDYQSKVQYANASRQELINALRPQAVESMRKMVAECDAGLSVQLQKFGTAEFWGGRRGGGTKILGANNATM